MNHNMSIYRWLNPRLLVQAELDFGLLYWVNMSNIYLYHTHILKNTKNITRRTLLLDPLTNENLNSARLSFFFAETQTVRLPFGESPTNSEKFWKKLIQSIFFFFFWKDTKYLHVVWIRRHVLWLYLQFTVPVILLPFVALG